MDVTQPRELPPGDYCIVELFGHTTLVGRYAEVERFGTKMLAIEPLFKGELLPVVFHGGAAIYRMTPCSAEIAFARSPQADYHLPPAIRSIVPVALLASAEADAAAEESYQEHRAAQDYEDEDEAPF